MCGRYQLTTEENIQEMQEIISEINRRYMERPIISQMKLGEIRPTDIVPVIANSKSFEPKPFLMQWGFSGFGEKPKPIINAVSETALTKNMFRKPLLERRCLIPATHFYEWQDTGYRKIKHVIKTVEPMIYMAGMYRFEDRQPLPLFTILTRPATDSIQHIHHRMPVILPKNLIMDWLSPNADISALISASDERMVYQAIQ